MMCFCTVTALLVAPMAFGLVLESGSSYEDSGGCRGTDPVFGEGRAGMWHCLCAPCAAPLEQAPDVGLEAADLMLDDVPDHLQVDPHIIMDDPIAQT